MSPSVRPSDIVVGLVTENTSQMLTQAIRLLRSIRWFGGELAGARVVVCGVGTLEAGARATLEALGAEIRTVSRFHPANPTANRHQLIAELLDAPQRVLFVLDCDTIVVRDPLPFLSGDAFEAKLASTPTVTDEVFTRLFAHFNIPKPPRSHIAPFSGTPTIPYFNAGVIAVPTALARTLAPVWRKYNRILADDPGLVAPCQPHMHQASLSLALAESGIPCRELPQAMNFQIKPHLTPPPGFAEIDPVIIHYHHLATEDGFLLPCPYPRAQQRIEMFHERLRAEGFAPRQRTASDEESRAVVVAGMHRSGTSLVAQLVNALGVYAGETDQVSPPDMFNPTGYWEFIDAVAIDREILQELGGNWTNVVDADPSRLSPEKRPAYVARIRHAIASLQGHGAFLLKDPRMSLLLPLWREALPSPVCVIVWREPMAVARSLAKRDKLPLLVSLAVWEHYNRTLLRDTSGMPRLLISYEELLAQPARVVRELHEGLLASGIRSTLPSEERIGQIVNADFNRSGDSSESMLSAEQRTLLGDLRSGAALRAPVAATPAHTVEVLAQFAAFEKREEALRAEIAERDRLLSEAFTSRSWRIGYGITGLWRWLRGDKSASAADQWRAMK